MRHQSCVLIVGLVLIAGAPGVIAQERQVGLKGGLSLATLDGGSPAANADGYDVRTGMTGGAFAVFPVQGPVGVQVEALFTEKGGSQPIHDPSIIQGSLAGKLRFQYLDLPVLARVTGPRLGSASLHGFAGPALSVRLSARYQEAFGGIGSFGYEYDIGTDTRRFDLGFTAGAGADIGRRLVVDARYTWGIRDVLDEARWAPVRNRGFLMTAGFRLF